MGKGKKMEKAIATEAALMGGSHYFQTLADPFNVHGEKIPDDITHPSSTFTIVDRRVLTLNASGFGAIFYGLAGGGGAGGGAVYGGLIPSRQVQSFDSPPKDQKTQSPQKGVTVVKKLESSGDPTLKIIDNSDGHFKAKDGTIPAVYSEASFVVGCQTTAASGASVTDVMPSVAGGGQSVNTFAQWDTNKGVPTLYSECRLVSGGVSIDYLGTALNAKGRITLVAVPRRTLRQAMENGSLTLVQIQNLVGARIVPVNQLKGGSLTYHPLDGVSFLYTDQQSAYDTTSLTHHDDDQAMGSEMFIVVDGAEASATCQITGVFNYEAIPKLGTLNIIQPTYSINDPIELSMTQNAIEKVPTATVGNKAASGLEKGLTQIPATSAPESSNMHSTEAQRIEGEEESFMTKVLDGAEGIAKNFAAAPGPLGMVGKAAPLVRQALGFLGV